MNRSVWLPLIAASLVLVSGCTTTNGGKGGKDTAGMANATMSLVTAATLSDAEVIELGKRTADSEDRQNSIAAANSKYAKRLQKLTANWKTVDGVKLDYKVYVKKEVNAFAVPNGSIRVYSGLMDKLTDDELRYVVAHEIGHVLLGHSKKAMQTAYATSAARQAAASSGNSAVAAIFLVALLSSATVFGQQCELTSAQVASGDYSKVGPACVSARARAGFWARGGPEMVAVLAYVASLHGQCACCMCAARVAGRGRVAPCFRRALVSVPRSFPVCSDRAHT